MGRGIARFAWLVLALLVLAGTVAALPGARASDPNYTLLGYAEIQGGTAPVPAGVTVDLISQASGQVYTTTVQTGTSGQFTFTTSSTGGALGPGWWGVWIPPQTNLTLTGCSPYCAVLPVSPQPNYHYENVTALTTTNYPVTIGGIKLFPYSSTLTGTVTYQGLPAAGATVALYAPTYPGLALVTNTSSSSGTYSLKVPKGTWILQTTVPGVPNAYNLTQVTIAAASVVDNVVVQSYLISGYANLASNPNAHEPNGGNLTIFDVNNGNIYSAPILPGGFYSFGAYPAGFTGPGSESFKVTISTVGYTTISYGLSVGPGNPTNHINVLVSPFSAPPAAYQTTLNFSKLNTTGGTGSLTVVTKAVLSNDSVLPQLPNASIGHLWGQLGLDYYHTPTYNPSNFATAVMGFVNSSGEFFPAVQAGTMVNGTAFKEPTTGYQFSNSTTCVVSCDLTSAATATLNWNQTYSLSGSIPKKSQSYGISFTFRHPRHDQSFNYTVVLPAGYVLNAGTPPPANSQLVAAGPGGTWTRFTLVSLPSSSASATASFTIVKYGNVTANVNVSVSNFAYSTKNVLNSTHGNYTVIIGVGQNATFSALNSTFPAGTNGTLYHWTFGDLGTNTTTHATTNHTYLAANKYSGTLTVTSSGGLVNSTTFTVYASSGPVTAQISSNATQTRVVSGVTLIQVNWSQQVKFNCTGSKATLYSGAPLPGEVAVCSWSIISHGFKPKVGNYSQAQGIYPFSNLTFSFLGAGYYLSSGTVGGTPVPFLGWQYNVSLTVWDSAGHSATSSLVVLVNDTQKPVASFVALNAAGTKITSGVTEAANHTAEVQLNGQNSSDPNNGSLTWYNWTITNSGNKSYTFHDNQSALPGYRLPPRPIVWLPPQTKPYAVNLTVTDRARNLAWTIVDVTVSVNQTTRPIMAANNLTAPATMTAQGGPYTIWVNITTTGGSKSVGTGVQVAFYLLPPSGGGSPVYIAGSPSTVKFYNYTNGVVNTIPQAIGSVNLAYNHTLRAEITWSPARTGNWVLYANVTAANEFPQNYVNGPQIAHTPVTINQNPIVTYETYGAIAAVAVAVILALIYFSRRRGRAGAKPTTGRAGLERGRKSDEDEEEEESKT